MLDSARRCGYRLFEDTTSERINCGKLRAERPWSAPGDNLQHAKRLSRPNRNWKSACESDAPLSSGQGAVFLQRVSGRLGKYSPVAGGACAWLRSSRLGQPRSQNREQDKGIIQPQVLSAEELATRRT